MKLPKTRKGSRRQVSVNAEVHLAMQQFSGVYRCLLRILMFRFEAQD
jgi:hypothetical protein